MGKFTNNFKKHFQLEINGTMVISQLHVWPSKLTLNEAPNPKACHQSRNFQRYKSGYPQIFIRSQESRYIYFKKRSSIVHLLTSWIDLKKKKKKQFQWFLDGSVCWASAFGSGYNPRVITWSSLYQAPCSAESQPLPLALPLPSTCAHSAHSLSNK